MMNDPILQTASHAIEKKDLPRARAILRDYVSCHRQSEHGWFLLSRASGTVENKRICLEHVLALNPRNATAAKELATLRRSTTLTGAPQRTTVTPVRASTPTVRPTTSARAQTPAVHLAARPAPVRASASKVRPMTPARVQTSSVYVAARPASVRTSASTLRPMTPTRAHTSSVHVAARPTSVLASRVGLPMLEPVAVLVKGLQAFVLLASLGFFLTIAVSVVPFVMGYRTLVIGSGSMEPNIPTGGIVIARPVPSRELGIGDVIVFSPNPDATIPIVHRIVGTRISQGKTFFKTQGDANPHADNAEVSLPATAWLVDYSLPVVGYVIMFATSPAGIAMFIILPLLALAFLSLREKMPQLASAWASLKPTV